MRLFFASACCCDRASAKRTWTHGPLPSRCCTTSPPGAAARQQRAEHRAVIASGHPTPAERGGGGADGGGAAERRGWRSGSGRGRAAGAAGATSSSDQRCRPPMAAAGGRSGRRPAARRKSAEPVKGADLSATGSRTDRRERVGETGVCSVNGTCAGDAEAASASGPAASAPPGRGWSRTARGWRWAGCCCRRHVPTSALLSPAAGEAVLGRTRGEHPGSIIRCRRVGGAPRAVCSLAHGAVRRACVCAVRSAL